MEETFEQKIIRNVKAGGFAVYKTPQVVGDKTMLANIEWEDPEEVDKFFAFARSLGAKIIYVSESEEEEEENTQTTSQPKMPIVQIGFLHDSVMHHINLLEDEEEDDEESEEDEEGEEYEEDDEESDESDEDEYEEPPMRPAAPQGYQQPPQSVPRQQMNSSQGQPPQGTPQPSQGWPRPQF